MGSEIALPPDAAMQFFKISQITYIFSVGMHLTLL